MQSSSSNDTDIQAKKHASTEDQPDNTEIALIWVEKAQSGSLSWPEDATAHNVKYRRIRKQLKPVRVFAKYALLLLGFIETPTWCADKTDQCTREGLPHARIGKLPEGVDDVIAIILWCYILFSLVIRYHSLGSAHHFGAWHKVGLFVAIVALCDCLKAVATQNHDGFVRGGFRISFVMRPIIFLCFTKSLREAAARIVRCTAYFYDVLIALGISVVFTAWIVLVLFAGAHSFKDWPSTIGNLWVLFTTANCPDVFLDLMQQNYLTFLFFATYIVATIYLLSNILLSSVYDGYKAELVKMLQVFFDNRQKAITKSFQALTQGGSLTNDKFKKFFLFYCRCHHEHSTPAAKEYNEKRAQVVFDTMDKDNNGYITQQEFTELLDVLHDEHGYIPKTNPPTYWLARQLVSLFDKGVPLPGGGSIQWKSIEDGVIALDIALSFYVTCLFAGAGLDEHVLSNDSVWFWQMFAFSCFYVFEVSLKIIVFGFERFWFTDYYQNRFDFINVYTMFAATLACIIPPQAPLWLFRQVLLQHIFRAFRLLEYIKPMKFIATLAVRLSPAYFRMGMMLFLVYYVYAMLGIEFFGGQIFYDNERLKGTAYAESNYYTMNFNDFGSSLCTLFVLMVVNNWFVIAAAFMKTSDSRWPAAYFVSFFVICNLIVLNILMALILDCSAQLREEMESSDDGIHGKKKLQYEDLLKQVLKDDLKDDPEEEGDEEKASIGAGASVAGAYGATS